MAKENGEKGHEAWALWLLGEIYSRQTRAADDKVESFFHKSQTIAVARHMRPLVAHCHLGLARLYRYRGVRNKARQEFDAAIGVYRGLDMEYWLKTAEADADRDRKFQLADWG